MPLRMVLAVDHVAIKRSANPDAVAAAHAESGTAGLPDCTLAHHAAAAAAARTPSSISGKSDHPAQALRLHCRDQPHLALLLQHALSQARPGADTGARLVRAVSRLLLLAKQRAALPQHAWSMKLSPAPVSPQYLRSLRGPGRSICTPRCARSSHAAWLADLKHSSCKCILSQSAHPAVFGQPGQP